MPLHERLSVSPGFVRLQADENLLGIKELSVRDHQDQKRIVVGGKTTHMQTSSSIASAGQMEELPEMVHHAISKMSRSELPFQILSPEVTRNGHIEAHVPFTQEEIVIFVAIAKTTLTEDSEGRGATLLAMTDGTIALQEQHKKEKTDLKGGE